jgi:hypothetical protein
MKFFDSYTIQHTLPVKRLRDELQEWMDIGLMGSAEFDQYDDMLRAFEALRQNPDHEFFGNHFLDHAKVMARIDPLSCLVVASSFQGVRLNDNVRSALRDLQLDCAKRAAEGRVTTKAGRDAFGFIVFSMLQHWRDNPSLDEPVVGILEGAAKRGFLSDAFRKEATRKLEFWREAYELNPESQNFVQRLENICRPSVPAA